MSDNRDLAKRLGAREVSFDVKFTKTASLREFFQPDFDVAIKYPDGRNTRHKILSVDLRTDADGQELADIILSAPIEQAVI